MLRSLRTGIRRVLPAEVRHWVYGLPGVKGLHTRLFAENTENHDEFYTREYYSGEEMLGEARRAAATVVRELRQRFAPTSLIDVGCGTGEYLDASRNLGIDVHGVELAEAALACCREKNLDVRRVDLTSAAELPWTADLVMSIEVAEHLPERFAANYVRLLTGAARRVLVMTAAAPGQVGVNHFNCRPKAYWADLVGRRGLTWDQDATESFETMARNENLPGWFMSNVLVFRRDPRG